LSANLKRNIKALKKGNELAAFQLYQSFSQATYNSILRIVAEEDTARDILQEAFIKAFGQIEELKEELAFGGWLKRIAINLSLQAARNKDWNLESLGPEIEDQIEEEILEVPSLEFSEIQAAINLLPNGCRLIFQLFYLEEYSHKEISIELNTSESNSKTQLRYAKSLLKKRLKTAYESK
jgi:RNA polymerase sigma factor (sigma-70 family)